MVLVIRVFTLQIEGFHTWPTALGTFLRLGGSVSHGPPKKPMMLNVKRGLITTFFVVRNFFRPPLWVPLEWGPFFLLEIYIGHQANQR